MSFRILPTDELEGVRRYLAKRCNEATEGGEGEGEGGEDAGAADLMDGIDSDEVNPDAKNLYPRASTINYIPQPLNHNPNNIPLLL